MLTSSFAGVDDCLNLKTYFGMSSNNRCELLGLLGSVNQKSKKKMKFIFIL